MAILQRHSQAPRAAAAQIAGLRMAVAFLALQWLAGCTANPSSAELLKSPPHVQNVIDARAPFREAFCRRYAQQSPDAGVGTCNDWLWRLPDEAAVISKRNPEYGAPSGGDVHDRILIVPGAFAECFGEDADPFGDALPSLRSKGYVIDIVPVEGRSGNARNAQLISAWIETHSRAGEPLILIGYSKGINDILQYLIDFPASAPRVKAVVSIAGAVGGTPLADSNAALFDLTGAHLPSSHCEPGDRQVLNSLRRDVRTEWLARHPLPAHIRYFSLAAFATHDRVAHALLPTWRILLRADGHTDGQVLARDAVIPGSTLLGYVNADHWEVALGIERRFGFLAGRQALSTFPRGVLLESVLDLAEAP